MKLKEFRIYNYKSITDSGVCKLADDMTVLVGKNESGKTAVLEALGDFDRDGVIDEAAYPLSAMDQDPRLEMSFEISSGEIEELARETNLALKDPVRERLLTEGIRLTKTFAGKYQLNDFLHSLFNEASPDEKLRDDDISQLQTIQAKINSLQDFLPPGAPLPDITAEGGKSANLQTPKIIGAAKARLMLIKEEEKRDQAIEFLRTIVRDLKGVEESLPISTNASVRNHFIYNIVQRLPRFVFFSDLEDILPFKVSYEDIDKNPAVQNFARIAKLDFKKAMQTEDLQRRINIFNAHTATICTDFLKRWGQSQIEIIARPEGDSILFGVKESQSADFFKIDQRSKGFQWFLSFYLKLQSHESDSVVVLVDEPGINLHPIAQKDILTLFKDKSDELMQIIYSTHSPSLIEANHLNRLRFIIKDAEEGTRIENTVNADVDEETLLPVKMAVATKDAANVIFSESEPDVEIASVEPTPPTEDLTSISEERDESEEPDEPQETDAEEPPHEPEANPESERESEYAQDRAENEEEESRRRRGGIFGWRS